ncbi:cation:proton antiporter [Streptomyces sp. NRRL S-87]|uniref:cation:proton antiporter n=1 Tax=Streptomyces sp. NRRL S-87 TaxID=1463920 RepID=UPI000690A54B|nr:cation:proton antiporter [Streptomyces sp. NRRL S-87]
MSMLTLDTTGHFFLGAAVVLALSHLAGTLCTRLGQPRVMGEVIAGIALGPSLLGSVAPGATAWLFPSSILPMFNGLAQLGLAVFMFATGQELCSLRVRGTARQGLVISQASLLIPFAAGSLVAIPLADRYAPPGLSPLVFVLFVGCAVSITAFPVLARMLDDLGIARTRPGRLSLLAAAIGDGGSWLALSAILALAQGSDPVDAAARTLAVAALIALYLGPVRKLAARWSDRHAATANPTTLRIALVVAVGASAALTAALGVHQLIGAFLVGLVWPPSAATTATTPLTSTAKSVLLPFFFLGYGLNVDLSTLTFTGGAALVLAALLAVAVLTKIVGTGLAARSTGLSWRESLSLGALLNTRGLTELVVLQIGHESHLLTAPLFAILTLVALITTLMTGPLLKLTGVPTDDAPATPPTPAREPAAAP